MNTNPVEAKVRKSSEKSTGLLIKAAGLFVHAEYAELASCDFPVHASTPIPVEVPPSGAKSFVVGPFSGATPRRSPEGDYPHTIQFPVYRGVEIASREDFERQPSEAAGHALTKIPIMAIATGVYGVVDDKAIQTHCVLPIWNDGSAVLVRLDWAEGEASEGTPNPEWHLSASTGLPAALGLEHLGRFSRLPVNARLCRYDVHLTPWLLGAKLLEDKGTATPHPIWAREWCFEVFPEFSAALKRITDGLLGAAQSDLAQTA